MKLLHFFAALLLTSALSLPSFAGGKVIELGHEASMGTVRLPDSENGELTLEKCATCPLLRLRASAETRYQIGQRLVSLSELKQFLATNTPSSVVVMQYKDTNQLSRVVFHLAGLAR